MSDLLNRLKFSEQKFDVFFQCNPIPSYLWQMVDNDLILIDYNIAAKKIAKNQIKNMLGKKTTEIYKDQPEFSEGIYQSAFSKGDVFKKIRSFNKMMSEDKFLSVAFTFIPPDFVLVISEDITSSKQMEDKLKKKEDRLKELEKIVNHSPAVVFLWRNEEGWPVEFVSENVSQFGYIPEDFYSNPKLYAEIVHPEDLERVAAEVAQHSEEKECKEFAQEYRILSKSGSIRWLDDRTWIRRNSQGEITHYQGIIIDITNRKLAEYQSVIERKKADLYLDLAGVIIIALNREGKITLMNKKGYEVLEYEEGELLGKKWFEICIQKNKKEEDYEAFMRLIEGELEPIEFYENLIITKNGKEKTIAWHNTLLYDDDRNIVGTLSSGEDITLRKEVEKALKLSQKQLQKLNLEFEKKVEKRTEQFKKIRRDV